MKYKLHSPIKTEFPVVNLISDKNLERINFLLTSIGELPYNRIKPVGTLVIRKPEKQSFWKQLMETKPGFERGENE